MTPVKFAEHNAVDFWKDQPVQSLQQTYVEDKQPHQWSINCWKLSLWERIRLLFLGSIWTMRTDRISVLTLDKEDLINVKRKKK